MSDGKFKENISINIDTEAMKDDFRTYIKKKLQAKAMLPGQGFADLRQRLEKDILERRGCKFRTIEIGMKGIGRVIAASENEQSMFQVVERSTKDEEYVMKKTLDQLNADLSPSQIALINEILIWVAFGNTILEGGQLDVTVPAL